MELRIKKLDVNDAELAKKLFIWFQEDDGDAKIMVPGDHYLRNLLLREDFYVIVALDGDEVVGGLTAFVLPMYKEEVNEIFLYEIGVDANYRKKNIATELIVFLKKTAKKQGISEMYVGTEMHNIPAQKLYDKTGGKLEKIAWYVYNLD